MKERVFFALALITACCLFFSCSKEEKNVRYEKHHVVKKVFSNTPGALIVLNNVGPTGTLIVKDQFEREALTDGFWAQMTAECEDPTVLITGEIWVDGKLKLRKQGNSMINLSVKLKGDG